MVVKPSFRQLLWFDANTDSCVSLVADDTRIARENLSEKDVEDLQSDLEKLYHWQENNNMQFIGKHSDMERTRN